MYLEGRSAPFGDDLRLVDGSQADDAHQPRLAADTSEGGRALRDAPCIGGRDAVVILGATYSTIWKRERTGLPANSLSSTNSEMRPLYCLSSAFKASDVMMCFLSVQCAATESGAVGNHSAAGRSAADAKPGHPGPLTFLLLKSVSKDAKHEQITRPGIRLRAGCADFGQRLGLPFQLRAHQQAIMCKMVAFCALRLL